jgi:uncharacterized membrane protein
VFVCGAWLIFSWAPVAQHHAYHSHAYDFGFFDQVVWNTAQGRFFETTFVRYNFLGQHVEPVLLLFAAAYRVWPAPELMLLAQAAVAAWAAVPLYLGTRRLLMSAWAGLCVAVAYLLAPHVHGAVLFDFHPEVMGTALVFSAFTLLVHGRPGWALAAIGSLFLLKEEAALVGIGFALVFRLFGYRHQASWLLAASLLYLVLVVGVLMTAVRGEAGDLPSRYKYLGTSPGEVLTAPVLRPGVILGHVAGATQAGGAAYLLGTQALLPLAGPAALAAVPLLVVHLPSTHPPQQALTLQYAVLPLAVLFVAAVLGAARLARSPRLDPLWRSVAGGRLPPPRRAALLAAALLVAEGVGWLAGSPLGPRIDLERFRRTAHTAAIDRVLAAVPPDVPVSAQSGLVPHLSQRRRIWEFPRLRDATVVVVDRKGRRSPQSTRDGYEATLAALPERGFCLWMAEDGVELYVMGAVCASR